MHLKSFTGAAGIMVLVVSFLLLNVSLQQATAKQPTYIDAAQELQHHHSTAETGTSEKQESDEQESDGCDKTGSHPISEAVPEKAINCLAENGLVIYGQYTCPACTHLARSLGGYEHITAIYVECSQERDRCMQEKQTNYVPEIQIKGEVYQGSRAIADLAKATDCEAHL